MIRKLAAALSTKNVARSDFARPDQRDRQLKHTLHGTYVRGNGRTCDRDGVLTVVPLETAITVVTVTVAVDWWSQVLLVGYYCRVVTNCLHRCQHCQPDITVAVDAARLDT